MKQEEKVGQLPLWAHGLQPMGNLLGDDGNTPQVIQPLDEEAGALVHQLASPIHEHCPRRPDSPHLQDASIEGKTS